MVMALLMLLSLTTMVRVVAVVDFAVIFEKDNGGNAVGGDGGCGGGVHHSLGWWGWWYAIFTCTCNNFDFSKCRLCFDAEAPLSLEKQRQTWLGFIL